MKPHKFVAVLALALIIFLLPVPDRAFVPLVRAARSGSPIVIVGNSVINHVSDCDTDKRNLTALIADRSGLPVADASTGGQSLYLSQLLARIAIRRTGTRFVILPIPAVIDPAVALSLQNEIFFAVLTGGPQATTFARRFENNAVFTPSPGPNTLPFNYKGANYPEYAGIRDTFFAREKREMPCPENAGKDQRFIEGFYFQTFTRGSVSTETAVKSAQMQREAIARGVRLIIVLMPVNADDVPSRNPQVAEAIERRRRDLLTHLKRSGSEFIDLSLSLDPSGFADRWCACGHLNEAGRAVVADRIARAIG